MADFNFTSQICTTREQSERLLALGLRKETADMCLHGNIDIIFTQSFNDLVKVTTYPIIPAWSLHRLLEILGIWYLELWFDTDVYEQVITHIQERVEDGLYNKKFFEESKQIAMEKLEITLKSISNMRSDGTTAYEVRLNRDCTLGEFIRAVLTTYTKEWGRVKAFSKGDCEYSGGKILKSDFDNSTLEQMVDTKTVKANGGWSNMDYYVTLREKGYQVEREDKPEKYMKRNELVAHICQNFADMVAGCETYEDYFSLMDALNIAINRLPEVVEKEDIQGWFNPQLDMIAEEWK